MMGAGFMPDNLWHKPLFFLLLPRCVAMQVLLNPVITIKPLKYKTYEKNYHSSISSGRYIGCKCQRGASAKPQ
jgi:hypothetical protein